MKKNLITLGLLSAVLFCCFSCTNNKTINVSQDKRSQFITRMLPFLEKWNGMYHWKTVFNLSAYEQKFLEEHHIKYLYVRMFDVDYGEEFDGSKKSVPIATTRFISELPQGVEVIPVVYITQSAIKKDPHFAQLLYERILAMAKRNGFSDNLWEIQLDCDWASGTEANFFQLCREVVELARKDGIQVSATIRLHQLNQKVPPVDKGVLMLYNTGSLYDPQSTNSILSYDDVVPYLKNMADYELPLSMAYPIYSWGLLFRDNKFVCILHHSEFSNEKLYKRVKNNRFCVKQTHYLENVELRKGDMIRLEQPSFDEILKVKTAVERQFENQSLGTIIYHLDSLGISSYRDSDFNKILK